MCSISIIHDNVPVSKNWSAFLSNIHNKNELVDYIVKVWSRHIKKIPAGTFLVCSTKKVCVLQNHYRYNCNKLISHHGEADTRLILHTADALSDYDLVVIRSVDTDVAIIALYHLSNVLTEQAKKDVVIFVGIGSHRRYISLSELAKKKSTKSSQESVITPCTYRL